MTWERKGQWAMVRGNQTITKALVRGEPTYQVWHGDELHATTLKSFAEAVKAADLLLEIEAGRARAFAA